MADNNEGRDNGGEELKEQSPEGNNTQVVRHDGDSSNQVKEHKKRVKEAQEACKYEKS